MKSHTSPRDSPQLRSRKIGLILLGALLLLGALGLYLVRSRNAALSSSADNHSPIVGAQSDASGISVTWRGVPA